MMAEERILKPTDRVYDLVDVLEGPEEGKGEQEIIVIDGRGYERTPKPGERVYDLKDVLEGGESPLRAGAMEEEIRKIASETAERIAREIIPGIAERVIREEIEKLKGEDDNLS